MIIVSFPLFDLGIRRLNQLWVPRWQPTQINFSPQRSIGYPFIVRPSYAPSDSELLTLRFTVYTNSLLATLNACARYRSGLENEDENGDQWEVRQPSVHVQGPGRKHRLRVGAARRHGDRTCAAGVGANSSTESTFACDIAGDDVEVHSNSYKGKKGKFGDVAMDITVEAEMIVMGDMPLQTQYGAPNM
jgi:hypothetical protein